MLRKNICMLLVLLALGIFGTGMTVFADETEAGPENILEYKELGFSVKDPAYWEGLKGSLLLMPVSTSSVGEKTELYMTFLIYRKRFLSKIAPALTGGIDHFRLQAGSCGNIQKIVRNYLHDSVTG